MVKRNIDGLFAQFSSLMPPAPIGSEQEALLTLDPVLQEGVKNPGGKYSVSPSMSESALLVIAAGYVLCRPGLAGPSPSARVRPRTPPDNEWRDGGRVACAGAPAFTTSGCLLHRTAAVRRCRHLPGIIRCGLRTCMAGRARRRVRDTEGRIVYKLAHGGDYKYAPDH